MQLLSSSLSVSTIKQIVFLSFVLCAASSCSSGYSLDCVDVNGKVLYKGKPASGVRLTFYPMAELEKDKLYNGTATTDGSGNYKIKTFFIKNKNPVEGIPAGKYKVAVEWPKELSDLKDYDTGSEEMPDRLKGKYSKKASTPFELNIEVETVQLDDIKL